MGLFFVCFRDVSTTWTTPLAFLLSVIDPKMSFRLYMTHLSLSLLVLSLRMLFAYTLILAFDYLLLEWRETISCPHVNVPCRCMAHCARSLLELQRSEDNARACFNQ